MLHLAVLKFDNYEIHVDLHQSQHIAFVRHTPPSLSNSPILYESAQGHSVVCCVIMCCHSCCPKQIKAAEQQNEYTSLLCLSNAPSLGAYGTKYYPLIREASTPSRLWPPRHL